MADVPDEYFPLLALPSSSAMKGPLPPPFLLAGGLFSDEQVSTAHAPLAQRFHVAYGGQANLNSGSRRAALHAVCSMAGTCSQRR